MSDSATGTAVTQQVTYLYSTYEVNTTILYSIFSNTNFRRLVFIPEGKDTGQYFRYELKAEVETTGGTSERHDLLIPTGSVDLGELTVLNARNYHVNKVPPKQFDFLRDLSEISSSFQIVPVSGSIRPKPPGRNDNPLDNHLCYNIWPVINQSPIQDSTTLYNEFGAKMNIDKEEFFRLIPIVLQLNPRPPGS